ncbi:MAG: peptidylprolyl isomerase [Roseateles depolymerans]|uniref:Peptidyl-prolyl cis-trans isomerase n=1 Tax=Roseateles depolymerans TaxID=76731 RepID=A0A2W5FUU2_9BURK|nr:MAG: peptidylprolyl isomerase [Roseateles depolymerans]
MIPTRRHALLLALSTGLLLSACGRSSTDTEAAARQGWDDVTALSTVDAVVGTGASAEAGKQASVTYTGWLYDKTAPEQKGKQFDSNAGGAAFTFTVGAGQVIPGWDQGVAGMKVGGKRRLVIPASLGYGTGGSGPIPGGAALVFDVELTAIK